MVLLVCSVLVVILVCVGMVLKKRRLNKLTSNFNSLPGDYPLIGSMLKLCYQADDIHDFLQDVGMEANKNGGLVKLWLGNTMFFGVTNPKIMKTLSNVCLQKSLFYDFVDPYIGHGLLVSKAEVWRPHRRAMNPMFHGNVLRGFLPIFNKHAASLVEQLRRKVGEGEFNHWSVISSNTIETAYETLLGISNSDQQVMDSTKYAHTLDEITENFNKRIRNFLIHPNFIYNFTKLRQENVKYYATLRSVTRHAINSKRASKLLRNGIEGNEEAGYKSILDLMLEAQEDGSFDDKDVMHELDTLMLAGYDTTATTLTYVLLALAAYPEVQEKLAQEVQEVLGSSPTVSEQQLRQLVYLEAVLLETLRVFSTVPVFARKLDKTVVVDNYVFPKGGEVFLLNLGANSSDVWEDASEFRPERFLDKEGPDVSKVFYPFGVGRRNCIGKSYAMLAMKVSLSHVVRRLRVRRRGGRFAGLRVRFDVVLRPSEGFHVAIEERTT